LLALGGLFWAFLTTADLGVREEWIWALVEAGYLALAMAPYCLGYFLEKILRLASLPAAS